MRSRCSGFLMVILLAVLFLAWSRNSPAQSAPKNGGDFSNVTAPDPSKVVPKGEIIIKGAWYSASDSTTPVPEGSTLRAGTLANQYFGLTLPLPGDWIEKHDPPPPSTTGSYVLAQLTPGPTYSKDKHKGVIMLSAQDMFFTIVPATNAQQLVNFSRNHLSQDYKVELKPTETKISGQPFVFYAYWAPAAGIHWYVLATQIRCHAVQFVMSSQDTKMLESLVLDLNKMKLPAEANPAGGTGGGNVPVCIKDYAGTDQLLERVDPVFPLRRFNSVPVRFIIDKDGKVKYVHVLSAFPEQEKAVMDAVKQWKFRPYEVDGKRVEVETGVMFGAAAPSLGPATAGANTD